MINTSQGNEFINSDFTKAEVMEVVAHLRNNKSAGTDNIINEFLKASMPSSADTVVNFFNLILHTGITPMEWGKGIITGV